MATSQHLRYKNQSQSDFYTLMIPDKTTELGAFWHSDYFTLSFYDTYEGKKQWSKKFQMESQLTIKDHGTNMLTISLHPTALQYFRSINRKLH